MSCINFLKQYVLLGICDEPIKKRTNHISTDLQFFKCPIKAAESCTYVSPEKLPSVSPGTSKGDLKLKSQMVSQRQKARQLRTTWPPPQHPSYFFTKTKKKSFILYQNLREKQQGTWAVDCSLKERKRENHTFKLGSKKACPAQPWSLASSSRAEEGRG